VTTHWKEPVVCECGHTGVVHWAENDQPFSRQWERYSIEGFDGQGFEIAGTIILDEALAQMNPACPACGAQGKVRAGPHKKVGR
jgi:hypothetical protein